MWLFHLMDKIYEFSDLIKALNQEAILQSVACSIIMTGMVCALWHIVRDMVASYIDAGEEE